MTFVAQKRENHRYPAGKTRGRHRSYQEYEQSARVDGYRQIMEAREVFLKARIEAGDVYRESKNQLEEKS